MAGETTNIISKVDVPKDFPNSWIPFFANNYSFKMGDQDSKRVRIYPRSFETSIKNDTFFNGNSDELVKNFLDEIPHIRIREYMQDSRIHQIVNWIKAAKVGFNAGTDLFKNWSNTDFQVLLSSIPSEFRKAMEKHTASSSLPNMSRRFNTIKDLPIRTSMIDIPFIMYYQLMTAKNCGTYVLPYSGKVVDTSKGQDGWTHMRGDTSGEFGKALDFLLSNIKITTTPVWGGTQDNNYPQLEVKFDLFNDCMEGAVENYIFVQTIMAKNRYLQYNIFQQNPCLYDIEVKGYNRFFLCSGSFSCEYGGQSRKIRKSMANAIYKRLNDAVLSYQIELGELISIPDVYHLSFNFQPLLPNSLNNTLFRFMASKDSQIITEKEDMFKNVETALGKAWTNAVNKAQKNKVQSAQLSDTAEEVET